MKLKLATLVLSAFTVFSYAQDAWVVPADKADKLSPVEFSDETRATGKTIFQNNCASCHGQVDPVGFKSILPTATNPGAEKFQKNTDGELYYKIREGRATTGMPSFKAVLSIDEVWSAISYLRETNKGYVQEVAQVVDASKLGGKLIKLNIAYNASSHMIEAAVTGEKDGLVEPIAGADVALFAARMFGELPLGSAKATNNKGIALFAAPADLPADKEGMVTLNAKLVDDETFGTVKASEIVKVGIATDKPSLTEKRAMWNVVQKAPLWVMISYTACVLAAWGVIFLIMFRLREIFILGKEEEIAEA